MGEERDGTNPPPTGISALAMPKSTATGNALGKKKFKDSSSVDGFFLRHSRT